MQKQFSKIRKSFLLLLILPFFFGCQSESDDPAPNLSNNQYCYITSAIGTEGSGSDFEEQYIYDANNRLIRKNKISPGIPINFDYKYNSNNQIIRSNIYNNNDTILLGYSIFSYNVNGKLIKIESFSKNNNIFSKFITRDLEYDDNGKTKKEIYTSPQNNYYSTYSHTNIGYTKYKYSNSNILLNIYELEFDNYKQPNNSATPFFNIENNHNLTKYTEKDASGAIIQNYTISYLYNSNGYPIQQTRSSNNPGLNESITINYNCK